MVTTQADTSQEDGSDSDSSVFSFSVTISTIAYSGNAEWILDIDATYHVCPNKDWFFSFEKLDGWSIIMGDDHPRNMKVIGTFLIKMFDEMVRELKEVSFYVN